MGNLIECMAGSDRQVTLTLRDAAGAAVTTFTGAAVLVATVWPGDSQAASFSPTAVWVSPAAGTISLTFPAASTALLDPGDYPVVLAITAGGRTAKNTVATLRILAAPGLGTAAPVYGTYDEMLLYAPFIARLQAPSAQAGFREERALARKWLDNLLQRHYRGDRGYYGGRSPDYSLDYLYDWGRAWRPGLASVTLQAWLDASRLILTGPAGSLIREAVARRAIGYVCASQLGAAAGESSYQALAARFTREAEVLASQCTAEIDTTTPLDGVGDIMIDMGTADVLYG